MPEVTIDQAMQIAVEHHSAGRLKEAEGIYRQVLAHQANHPEALNGLGVVAHQVGRDEIAVGLIRRAVELSPGYVDAHNNLAVALLDLGKLEEASAACHRAIQLNPSYTDAYYNLGNILNAKAMFEQAETAYRKTLQLKPRHVAALGNLGAVLRSQGRLEEAIVAFNQAIQINPDFAEAYNNLGVIYTELGQLDAAVAACRRSILLRPGFADAYSNLGIALVSQQNPDEAILALREALRLKPNFADAYNNLGSALILRRQNDEAIAAFSRAIEIRQNYSEALTNLGNAWCDQGLLDEALSCYRRAVLLDPSNPALLSNELYAVHFHPEYDGATLLKEQRRWDQLHGKPLRGRIPTHLNDGNVDRKLRIGYVSPNFRDHVIGRNLLPLLREHDRDAFEVYCYSDVVRHDEITGIFRSHAEGWRNIVGVLDSRVAELVKQDQIDILIDLTLHMARGRLRVFAQKPAPVQVTFAGYPGTTGLEVIDYRLTDPYLDPIGHCDELYPEQSIRLPDTFWCYDPPSMVGDENPDFQVGPLMAASTGVATFGCLNNFCKVNNPVLALWARVLHAVAGSRLTLMVPQGSARRRTLDVFDAHGIDPERIEFVAFASRPVYLQRFNQIDIALDTVPYNGHTTSLDALWMGVPVVTLVGKTVVGRAGLSQLTNLKLTELVATSEEQYVKIAADLAGDLPRLGELRAGLRQRMRESPLTDAPKFARSIESAYRQMWRRWCQGAGQEARHE